MLIQSRLKKQAMWIGLMMLLMHAIAHAESVDSIVKSVKFDDVKDIRQQLQQGLNPNLKDRFGQPLLVIAAREQSLKVANLLLNSPKTDVNLENNAGENALMYASINNEVPLVNQLLTKQAHVNRVGWTPLHYAAGVGNLDVVKLLIAHGADVNASSPNGTTPLMMAARDDAVNVIQYLLNHGAQLTQTNQLNLNALQFAQQYQAFDAIKFLSQKMQQVQ